MMPDASRDAALFLTEVAVRAHRTDEFVLRHGVESTKSAPFLIGPTSDRAEF